MRPILVLAVAAAVLAALTSGCATTRPEDDPVQIKLNDIDARLSKIERIIANQSLVDLAQHLDTVQTEVRQLRGRVEELENSNESMRKQQRDLYSDLDKRITALQNGTSSGGGAGAGPGAPGPAGSTGAGGAAGPGAGPAGPAGTQAASSVEQAVYNQAFNALKAGSYSVAITGFKDFLSSYPSSPLASNAQYWLGEAYYVNHDYDNASAAFRNVVIKWPDALKAPDALLKLGYTQLEQKKTLEARTTLNQVKQRFPGTEAARMADDRLRKIAGK